MILQELITKFGVKVDSGALTGMERQLDAIKGKINYLAGRQLVMDLARLAQHFGELGEKIKFGALGANLSTTEFQLWTESAKRSRVEAGDMAQAIRRLSTQIYQAKQGSLEAGQAFADMGISSAQVAGFRNANQALYVIADRLRAIQDPFKRAALAQQLLGRGSAQMVAFLAQGSHAIRETMKEVERLGLVLTPEDVTWLARMSDGITDITGVMESFGNKVAAYFAPIVVKVIEETLKWYAANKQIIDSNLYAFLDLLVRWGFTFYEILKSVVGIWKELAKAFSGGDLSTFVEKVGKPIIWVFSTWAWWLTHVILPIFSKIATIIGYVIRAVSFVGGGALGVAGNIAKSIGKSRGGQLPSPELLGEAFGSQVRESLVKSIAPVFNIQINADGNTDTAAVTKSAKDGVNTGWDRAMRELERDILGFNQTVR